MTNFSILCDILSKSEYLKAFSELNIFEMHNIIAEASKYMSYENIRKSRNEHKKVKRAFYFSAEFLVGRAVYNNLISLGLLEEVKGTLTDNGADINAFEEIEDAALGNGGLGRLAACYLDSAASCSIPLDGYGIRYKYGLFKQKIEDGFQKEYADNWTQFGDRWSVRNEHESVTVTFEDGKVKAVPYDMPVFGYGTGHVSNIRLWQCEALDEFFKIKFIKSLTLPQTDV